MDQTTSSDPTASSPHSLPPSSPHSPLLKDPSGEAGVKGDGGMLNRGVPTVTCRPTRLTKLKGRKRNCSSSAAPINVNSTPRPPASSPHQTVSQDRTTGFSCLPTPPPSTPLLPDQRGAPVADGRLSPAASLTSLRGPLVQSSVGNERGRKENAKKKKEKDDKARSEKGKGKRGDKERGKEDRGRNDSPKMDRDEKASDEREKEGTGMDDRRRDMMGKEERKGEEDKESEKPRDLRVNKWPSSTRCQMLSEIPSRKTSTPSLDPDLTSGTGESDYPGGPSRPTVSPSNPSTASPSPSSPLTSLPPPSLSLQSSSPPTSPREQDSRPLKKRKTRRPSWTRLVNRAQRLAENPDGPLVAPLTITTPQTPPTTPQTLPTINSPNLRSAESCLAPSVPPPPSPSSLFLSTSTPVRPRPAGRPASHTQTHLLTSDPNPSPGPDHPVSQARKRGRPKSQISSLDKHPPRHSPKPTRAEVLPHGHDETPDPHVLNPVLNHSPTLTNPSSSDPTPRKRGRPKRLPPSPLKQTLQDPNRGTLTPIGGEEGGKDFPSEKGNRQLRMRSIIGEMKRRRLLREMLSGCGGGEEGRGGEGASENSHGGAGGVCGSPTAPSLSSSFGGNLVPQINVSKRGTIYMGKRRGRKPKAPANSNPASQSTLFTSLSGPSLFSSPQSQPHPPLSHPFPSPSLTHSSGAQSPYSDGGFTEPAPSLFLPHTFSLPSPSSSCASPRPLSSSFSSSSSISPSLKRSSPGQGRHPLFHHLSSRLSSPFTHPPHPLHPHVPVSPSHLKEATPSPISESHSEEILPSDSVIGLDHNSISEQGERRGRGRGGVTMGMTSEVTRSVFRTGLGVSLKGQRQLSPSMLLEHPSPVPSLLRVSASPPSPPSASPRHTHPSSDLVEPRDRHRYRRRGYECPYTCPPWPCLGHNQRSHLDLCPCLTLKRQKHKRKRKYQHLLMHAHDPDFLSELDDLIGQFSEVRIGRHRDWARAGLGQDLDESVGKRRHSSSLSSHHFRSNVYRINLSGYYSPHPLSYPTHPSLSPLHPCHGLPYGSRNPERRLRCGCPTKPCESLDQGDCDQRRRCPLQGNTGHLHPSSLSSPLSSSTTSSSTSMPLGFGYHRGFPLTMAHYTNPHLHPSFPLPPPHPYAPHLHPPHLLLNPARFHRKRSRQLRETGLGGGGGEDMCDRGEGERARVRSCTAGSIPGRSCVCGGNEHKLRHKHRHRQPDRDRKEEEEEEEVERVAGSQPRSEFTTEEGGSRKTGGQGSAGLRESPWHCKYPSSFSSASAKPASSSSSSSSERLKHTPLTCLGSSHLSSFGEGWGGRQNPWLRRGGLAAGFRPPNPTWGTLTEGQRTATVGGSEREAGESHTPRHSTFTPLTHTNLFTSATSGRGMRSGRDNWRPGSQDGSLRSEEPSQTERRGTGPHYDLSWRQLKWLRTSRSFGAKRGPGRPRKNPLASPLVSPTTPPNPPTETHVQNRVRNRGSRGFGDTVQEVIEAVIRRQRRRRRKRRRIEEEEKEEGERPPCLQSSGEGEPVTHTPSICTGQSELSQTPSLNPASQSDKGADKLPRKSFQRAGLYSDDYKTTDPSSQSQLNRERLEYTPGEQDYSLLPAPIHVGKYLRMRRIDFQLPFDVLWLFRHNQLHKELDVPLTREISSCQPKEKSLSSHQTEVSLNPSPQEECSSPSKKLFPHMDMEPMTTSDRVFVLKHHVFLLRNWEWVRDRQIRLRRETEGERDKEAEMDGGGVSSDVATGDKNIMSGRPVVVKKKVVLTSEPLSDPQCPPNPLSTTTHLTQPQNTREEKKQGEEEGRRKVRKERLNNILLKLRQA